MAADHYADAGLRYLPIERIVDDEFAPCRSGQPVLIVCGDGIHLGEWCDFGSEEGRFSGWDFLTDTDELATHFLPASLAPIGEHVAVEVGAVLRPGHPELYEVYGIQGEAPDAVWESVLGKPAQLVVTGVVRIPVRRPPHGEAL